MVTLNRTSKLGMKPLMETLKKQLQRVMHHLTYRTFQTCRTLNCTENKQHMETRLLHKGNSCKESFHRVTLIRTRFRIRDKMDREKRGRVKRNLLTTIQSMVRRKRRMIYSIPKLGL